MRVLYAACGTAVREREARLSRPIAYFENQNFVHIRPQILLNPFISPYMLIPASARPGTSFLRRNVKVDSPDFAAAWTRLCTLLTPHSSPSSSSTRTPAKSAREKLREVSEFVADWRFVVPELTLLAAEGEAVEFLATGEAREEVELNELFDDFFALSAANAARTCGDAPGVLPLIPGREDEGGVPLVFEGDSPVE